MREGRIFWHRCGKMGRRKRRKNFGLPKGENKSFYPTCLYTESQIFVENSNAGEKHEKNFDLLTRPPSRPVAAGPSICQLSPVARGGAGGCAGGALCTSLLQVTGVTAMLSTDEALVDKLATADIVTTAVGVNILPRIAPTVAQGLKLRRLKGIDRPLNIIACENAVRATTALKAHVLQHLEEEDVEFVKAHVGFVDSAVDRIVPSMDQVGPHHTQSEADEVRVSWVDRGRVLGPS